MKKLHSLFILSILALTMFVGCQMNPEDVKDVLNKEHSVNVKVYDDKAFIDPDNYGDYFGVIPVTISNSYAKENDIVTITVKTPDNYVLKGVTVKEGDNYLDVTKKSSVSYTFKMEPSTVNVYVKLTQKTSSDDDTIEPVINDGNEETVIDETGDNNDNNETVPSTEGEDDNGDGEEAEDPVDEDDSKPVDNTPTVDPVDDTPSETTPIDDNGGEEVVEPNYTVLAPDGSVFASNMPYNEFDYYKTILTKDVDYVEIDEYTCKLTQLGYANVTNTTPVTDNPSDDDTTEENPTPNPTGTTSDTYDVFARARVGDGYRLDNTSSESDKEVELPIMTSEGTTPTGLYLVNVRIEDKSTGNDIKNTVNLKIEDNKIKFTMPSTNVDVYASFENVSFKKDYNKNDNGRLNVTTEKSNNSDFDVGLRFTEKVFDNLEYIDGYYVFRVANKGAFNAPKEWDDTHWLYQCTIETTYTEHVLCAIVGEKVTPSGNHKIDLQ